MFQFKMVMHTEHRHMVRVFNEYDAFPAGMILRFLFDSGIRIPVSVRRPPSHEKKTPSEAWRKAGFGGRDRFCQGFMV